MSAAEETAIEHRVVLTVQAADLWLAAADAGRMIGYDTRTFSERIATRPDFPRPVRIDGKGFPRWNAGEISQWMREQRERTGGRPRS